MAAMLKIMHIKHSIRYTIDHNVAYVIYMIYGYNYWLVS